MTKQFAVFINPLHDLQKDYKKMYTTQSKTLSLKTKSVPASRTASSTVYALLGAQLGDEGKGRVVDNVLEKLLKSPKVKKVFVVRVAGGSNAGHTVEKGGQKIALHQVPSMVFHKKVIGIMERGMVVHAEDLQTEYEYVEEVIGTGKLAGRLLLSRDAILCTDLERAKESLNAELVDGAKGGTKRGIGPAYASYYDKTGVKVSSLMAENWRESIGRHYDRVTALFKGNGKNLAQILVPDFKASVKKHASIDRSVGTKDEFLKRLGKVRTWLIDKKMVQNTYAIHIDMLANLSSTGVIFEGAQAVGLNPWMGTIPDVTASDTSLYGVLTVGPWTPDMIGHSIGVFKVTYMSSVGARHMATEVRLDTKVLAVKDLPATASADEKWAAWVRDEGHEFGTTTGRPRDICFLDLPFMAFNCYKGGVTALAATHLDIASEDEKIKVCTHYEKKGTVVAYQPGLEYQEGVTPQYIELDGWDGKTVRKAKSFKQLPINAQKYLAFIQERIGVPIILATTGPSREHMIEFVK
jgi:adenylosuccinate synthase